MEKSKEETKKGKMSKTHEEGKKRLEKLAVENELQNGLIDTDPIIKYKIANKKVKSTDNLGK